MMKKLQEENHFPATRSRCSGESLDSGESLWGQKTAVRNDVAAPSQQQAAPETAADAPVADAGAVAAAEGGAACEAADSGAGEGSGADADAEPMAGAGRAIDRLRKLMSKS